MKSIHKAVLLLVSALPVAAQQGMVASHAKTVPVSPAPQAAVATRNPASPEMKKPVARVNGQPITQFDLQEQMQRVFPYYSMHGGQVPEKYQAEIRQRSIDQLVVEELIYQDAKRQGMAVTPAMMQKTLKSAKERLGSLKDYQDYAQANYGSVAEFERRLRRARLIAEYEHREIELKAKPTEQKIRDFYEKNPKMFLRPETVHIQTISVNVPQDASADQKKLAMKRIQEILPQARATKDFNSFGLLAEKVSEDDYRVNLGDHKWVMVNSLPPVVAKPLAALQPGQMTDILETEIGYMIVRVDARSPEKMLEFGEAKDHIRQQMEQMTAKKRWESLTQDLRKSAKVEIL